jgi:hypothetical protein
MAQYQAAKPQLFITTTVNRPHPGGTYLLRWRMGSDGSVSGEGWRIDTVAITQCPNLSRLPRGRLTPHQRPDAVIGS